MKTFEGKLALVTGAARGIGLATAEALAAGGARVLMVDINPQVQKEATRLRNDGAKAEAFVCDLGDDAAVDAMGIAVTERYGTPDLLFNIAFLPMLGGLDAIVVDDWRRAFEVNVFGYLRIVKAFVRGMIERGNGWIVNTASPMGFLPDSPYAGLMLPYCACKGADIGLTAGMTETLKSKGVGVSLFLPDLTASWAGTPPGAVPDSFKEELGEMIKTGASTASAAEALLAGLKAGQYLISADPKFHARLVAAAENDLDPTIY
jgi:NAD(P)-dependent dehydrogenase (short-subunit alcohol dehydrogenase family)